MNLTRILSSPSNEVDFMLMITALAFLLLLFVVTRRDWWKRR